MAVWAIFPDGMAIENLVLLLLPGVYLHASAVVILCLYHASLLWKLYNLNLKSVFFLDGLREENMFMCCHLFSKSLKWM